MVFLLGRLGSNNVGGIGGMVMYFSDASFISLLCVTIVFVVCRPLSVHFTVVCFFSSSSLLHLCSFFFFSLCRWVERWMWLCVFFLGEVSSDLVSPQVKEKEKVRRKEKYHSHVSTKAHTHTHSLFPMSTYIHIHLRIVRPVCHCHVCPSTLLQVYAPPFH